jgi:hypothetical protein
MTVHHLPIRLARALAAPRFAAGVVVTLALLTAACSNDSASRINAPPLVSSLSSDRGSSGGAAGFTVLAGTAVDCTRSTVIGQVGIYPGSAFTPVSCITGAVHAGDAAAQGAMQAFFTAYDNVARISCTGQLLDAYTNTTLTLPPGVYCNPRAAGVTFTGTTLTLNAEGNPNAVWIFKIGTPGTAGTGALTGTDLSVVMTGGSPCNVTWWTAQAATLTDDQAGVPRPFVGTILAGTSITTTGTNTAGVPADRLIFTGNAFAKAAVTLTDTNLTGCASSNGGNNGDKGDNGDNGDKGDKGDKRDQDHGDGRGGHDGGDHGDGRGGHGG